MPNTKLFRVKIKDLAESITMFFITTVINSIIVSAHSGSIPTDIQSWKHIGITAGIASVSYLSNNFLRNSKGDLLRKEVYENNVPK